MLVRYSIVELLMVFEVSAQREHTIEMVTLLQIVSDSPVEMYSKFVLPNWTLLCHILKWVGKWPVTDHYFEL